jgi:hypothetical protein
VIVVTTLVCWQFYRYFDCTSILESCDMIIRGINSVLEWKVKSPLATAAQETASSLLKYCGNPPYPDLFLNFSDDLVKGLATCFIQKKIFKLKKEVMWGHYHIHRSSATFHKMWSDFVEKAVRTKPSPIFYQHITHEVFKELVKKEYPVSDSESTAINTTQFTREHENTLRYVGGYIVREINKELQSLSDPGKDDMLLCLIEMYGDEMNEAGTEDWTNAIDRGGLWHINDQAYLLFYAMEKEICNHFKPASASALCSNEYVVSAVLNNEEVLFHWCLLTAVSACIQYCIYMYT